MTLSENGSKIFSAQMAWQDYCYKHHIEDPWKLLRNCENKINKHWSEIDEHGHTIWKAQIYNINEWPQDIQNEYNKLIEYRDQYMCDREIWEGKYILKNFGYDVLSIFAQAHSQEETALKCDRAFWDWFAHINSCEGANGQCAIFCEHIGNCEKEFD